MATRYVGPGGNDGNNGLSWAQRKLTLNGVEDTPVVATDIVYVGPGVYREQFIVDVSGGAGANVITYIGDVTGEHTDGVGGIVRITGSDNDQTAVRLRCIWGDDEDYRVFRGFMFDLATDYCISLANGSHHWTIEDCSFESSVSVANIRVEGLGQSDVVIRRCIFHLSGGHHIGFSHAATIDNTGHLVENCIFSWCKFDAINIVRIGDITVRNCFFSGIADDGIDVQTAPAGGHPCIVENCIFAGCRGQALEATGVGDMTEDFNTFFANTSDRFSVNVGANSETYPPLFLPPILHAGASQVSGFKFPWLFGMLSQWSQIRAITGSNEPSIDLFGVRRPVTASKNSWGPCQFQDYELESGTVQAGTYSRVLHDAGCVLVRRVPVTGVEITVTLYVRREANYAGNLPRMIIKQPGQADQITVSVAAVNTWEQLSDTFTPASPPGFIEVWVESRNTAAAGNYETFYDTMGVN